MIFYKLFIQFISILSFDLVDQASTKVNTTELITSNTNYITDEMCTRASFKKKK